MGFFSFLTTLMSVLGAVIETPVFISQGTFTPAGHASFEVRDYAPSVAAETCRENSNEAFNILAEYIGVSSAPSNDRAETIAMTSPVVTYQQNDQECMQFILPESVYGGDVTSAPAPSSDDVTLVSRPQMLVAATSFNGWASADDFSTHLEELKLSVQQMDDSFPWMVKEPEQSEGYQYDGPWVLGPWRTNEVVVQLVPKN